MSMLKVGAKAPSFNLPDQEGKKRGLKNLGGDYVVLYFYPKDDTPGCTVEAREFSNNISAFKRLGASVVGVSGGDVKSKDKFCQKHGLEITLLADTDFEVAKSYGAYGKKKFMGREYMGILRKTFVLDKLGKLVQLYADVKPEGHAEQVLEFLKAGKAAPTSKKTAGRVKGSGKNAMKTKKAASSSRPAKVKSQSASKVGKRSGKSVGGVRKTAKRR
jgi:peroxiredoxin Q/BCP